MYLIHEENHSCLCVAEDLCKGILWLIKNDWLNGETIGVDKNDNDFLLKDIIPRADENKYLIFAYLIELFNNEGKRGVFEFLEKFGIYFNEIEVA